MKSRCVHTAVLQLLLTSKLIRFSRDAEIYHCRWRPGDCRVSAVHGNCSAFQVMLSVCSKLLVREKQDLSRRLLFCLAPIFLCACSIEKRLIFYPTSTIERTPGDIGLAYEDVYFTSEDGVRLNGWFVPYPKAQRTLLWFHGNAGNIGHRVENLGLLHSKLQINVFIFDYRGYGRSTGEISESGTYLDGRAAIAFLRERRGVQAHQLILFGRSLGAAVAAEMASSLDCLALILESPFVSVPEMARTVFPIGPFAALLSTRYDTVEKVRRIRNPLLVLHGDQDEVVPYTQGRKVFEAAPEPKRFHTIVGARHNDTYIVGGERYFAVLRDTLEWAGAVTAARTPRS
jgi:fermentation-respiration switch protein FrsA (DUF1100 family)